MADKLEGRTQQHGQWTNVRPVFLIGAGLALVFFGMMSGIALDLATRPAPKPQIAAAPPPQPRQSLYQFLPPSLPDPALERTRSILESSRPEPERAWAPGTDRPLVAYAISTSAPAQRPVIAIVIDDMGLDRPRALKVIELPGPLTLSLMTYADGLAGLVAQAHGAGHEVMAHLPMEPLDAKENPGPGALTVAMDDVAIRARIAGDLDGWQGYVGINNHMGSRFTMDKARMGVVMEELKSRGLMWLDSKTTGDSVGPAAARAIGVPYVERDVFLDNIETVEAVTAQLGQVESIARAHGSAVAIGHPHDATIAALKQWLPKLESQGFTLVPITEILKRRTAAESHHLPPS